MYRYYQTDNSYNEMNIFLCGIVSCFILELLLINWYLLVSH